MVKINNVIMLIVKLSDHSLLYDNYKYLKKVLFRLRKQGPIFRIKIIVSKLFFIMKSFFKKDKLDLVSCRYSKYIKLYKGMSLKNKPVKMIAFYVPWFNCLDETETLWNNKKTGRVNNEKSSRNDCFDFFQLNLENKFDCFKMFDEKSQHRQLELARIYDLSGLCFLFFWQRGKPLFDKPLFHYLNDASIEIPICLCLANYGSSGIDGDYFGRNYESKEYSPDEDLLLIKNISKCFKDERYIRVSRKPLLIVNNPGQLLFPRQTSATWRNWCHENGIGAIYLAYIKPTYNLTPVDYGFDAEIDFSSMNIKPQPNNFFSSSAAGRGGVDNQDNEEFEPDYDLFYGFCFSWSTPQQVNEDKDFQIFKLNYHKKLCSAIDITKNLYTRLDQQLIFINLWNYWTSEANLNPDNCYGYAYHEATRMALVRRAHLIEPATLKNEDSIAVVIHAYYEDIFLEILSYLDRIASMPIRLYVTTTYDKLDSIAMMLSKKPYKYKLLPVNNHGRDVLPFLKIIPEVKKQGHSFFIKVHTKKSPHRVDGIFWREDLFEKILTERAIENALSYFYDDPSTGIIGPKGHVLPMFYKWPANALRVEYLAMRMGIEKKDLKRLKYPVGSMFIARIDAIEPLINLSLDDDDFEPEAGQFDGTLAHCMERLFTVSAFSKGLKTR